MIVRSQFVRGQPRGAARAAWAVHRARLAAHLRYLVFRPDHTAVASLPAPRPLFTHTQDVVSRQAAAEAILASGCSRVAYHLLVLAPASDEPVLEVRAWTRGVLADLGRRLGLTLTYVGAAHAGPHPHIHVVLAGSGLCQDTRLPAPVILRTPDLTYLRQRGRDRSAYALLRGLSTPPPNRLLYAHPVQGPDHLLGAAPSTAPCLLPDGQSWAR